MSLPYKKPSEFHDRYSQSVIYYDNEPVWIHGVSPQTDRGLEEVPDDVLKKGVYLVFNRLPWPSNADEIKQHKYLASDPSFTAIPIHTGYANVSFKNDEFSGKRTRYASYISRAPVRRNKQGLGVENVVIPSGQSLLDLLYDSEFVSMLKNQYKSFYEVRELVVDPRNLLGITAFSQKFALEYDTLDQFVLHFRGEKVGYSLDGDKFTLGKNQLWLRETLEELGISVKDK